MWQWLALLLPWCHGLPRSDEETEACLLGVGPCDESTTKCGGAGRFSRRCLEARVPFRTPYARVRCCMRCCFAHWVRRYGLDARWAAFRDEEDRDGAAMLWRLRLPA